jgi:hypothetical protein
LEEKSNMSYSDTESDEPVEDGFEAIESKKNHQNQQPMHFAE